MEQQKVKSFYSVIPFFHNVFLLVDEVVIPCTKKY